MDSVEAGRGLDGQVRLGKDWQFRHGGAGRFGVCCGALWLGSAVAVWLRKVCCVWARSVWARQSRRVKATQGLTR